MGYLNVFDVVVVVVVVVYFCFDYKYFLFIKDVYIDKS